MAEARLRARADMNTSGFDAGLAKMRQGVTSFSTGQLRSLAGMVTGAFAVGSIINFGREAIKRADDLGNLSNAAGMSVESLQAMQWAMKEFGAATDESSTAKLMKLVNAQGQVINGNKSLSDAFRRLGISEKEVAELNTDQLLYRVAVGAKSSGTAVADLNTIFGKGAAFEMKDALDKLANDGMGNLIQQAKNAGQVLDQELISKMGQLNDDLDRTSRQAGNFLTEVAAKASNGLKNVAALYGAIGGVGIMEAVRQYSNGEIGVAREQNDAMGAKSKEAQRREAEKQARIDALQARKDAEKALTQSKIDKIMGAPMGAITVGAPVAADQYSRMGGFSGGQVNNSGRMVAERQLKVAEEMAKRLEKVQAIMENVETNTADTASNLEE